MSLGGSRRLGRAGQARTNLSGGAANANSAAASRHASASAQPAAMQKKFNLLPSKSRK